MCVSRTRTSTSVSRRCPRFTAKRSSVVCWISPAAVSLWTASNEEQLKKIKSFGIILTDLERNAQKLWHSILGAAYIKNELHITDPEIVDPVLYHTTARADMTLPEKILFIADYISADRRYDGVEEMRRVAYEDLDRAVLLGSRETIRDLAERYMAIHPDTMGAFNWCVMNQRISK